MKRLMVIVLSAVLLTAGSVRALSYVESSNGLSDPGLESGRSELEFADINNDGNVDILSIGDHGNPYVGTQEHGVITWFGDGQGNWSVYQNENDTFGYGGITVGDVNNDGFWDVAVGMHHNYASPGRLGTKILDVGLGDSTGRDWTPWDSGLASHGETWGMFGTAFADFNNDGWLDLASNSFGGSAGVHVYLNYHNGFWDQSFGFTGGMSKCDIAVGDINDDGNSDFVVGQQYGSVYLGDGAGGFTLKDRNLPLPNGQQGRPGIALGDIDNDGAREFSFVDTLGGIQVWKWNPGADSWTSMKGALPDTGYQATRLCDMNCDGFVDLFGFGRGHAAVWLGDGTGGWTQAAGFTTPSAGDYTALETGSDVDHNGFPDIALIERGATRNVCCCFKEASAPESLWIFPLFPRTGESFYPGSVQFIDWTCAVPAPDVAQIRLELSFDGPSGPWSLIRDNLKNGGRFQWTVPNQPSVNCYLRLTATSAHGSRAAITPGPFTILPSLGISRNSAVRTPQSALGIQVYPNPVTSVMTVRYTLPAAGPVVLTLYDINGKLLATLLNGHHPAGAYSYSLLTTHHSLAGGVYLVRLQNGSRTITSRVCIVD
jgi:hypothetical protein